jgi:hypothetical protein
MLRTPDGAQDEREPPCIPGTRRARAIGSAYGHASTVAPWRGSDASAVCTSAFSGTYFTSLFFVSGMVASWSAGARSVHLSEECRELGGLEIAQPGVLHLEAADVARRVHVEELPGHGLREHRLERIQLAVDRRGGDDLAARELPLVDAEGRQVGKIDRAELGLPSLRVLPLRHSHGQTVQRPLARIPSSCLRATSHFPPTLPPRLCSRGQWPKGRGRRLSPSRGC